MMQGDEKRLVEGDMRGLFNITGGIMLFDWLYIFNISVMPVFFILVVFVLLIYLSYIFLPSSPPFFFKGL